MIKYSTSKEQFLSVMNQSSEKLSFSTESLYLMVKRFRFRSHQQEGIVLLVFLWKTFKLAHSFQRPDQPFVKGAGMAQWWDHSPPTNVARVRFPDSASYVGWICCWFSSLLREVFLRVLRFSPLLENQHFQIPIRSGIWAPQVCQSKQTVKCQPR